MSDPYFYCFRCKQHKAHRLLSSHTSPSGIPCCTSCAERTMERGVSTSKAGKRLTKHNADYLAATLR